MEAHHFTFKGARGFPVARKDELKGNSSQISYSKSQLHLLQFNREGKASTVKAQSLHNSFLNLEGGATLWICHEVYFIHLRQLIPKQFSFAPAPYAIK